MSCSFNRTPADNTSPSAQVARRVAVPPQVSARHAEHHGRLDAGGKVDTTMFNLLANQKDFDAAQPGAALIQEEIPLKGPLDPTPVGVVFAVYRDGESLTYLPDPLSEIVPLVRNKQGWLHVDGAFGGWVAASAQYRQLVAQLEQADSFSVDCHKWLNVPYDSGLVFVRDRAAHYAAMTLNAAYYVPSPEAARDNHNWVPEASRRARCFAIYAALRALGSNGVASIVERCCHLARRFAERLATDDQVQILNDVVINQVLVRFENGEDDDAFTAEIIRRVQEDGTCWAGGTTWQGKHALRISVSNWSTTESDIDRSAAAILACLHDRK